MSAYGAGWNGRALAGPYFLPLGDLPGGAHQSQANAISRDGRVVVGFGSSQPSIGTSQSEAFRWTLSEGMVGLGALPSAADDGRINSIATGVSADGSVIIGHSDSQARPNGEAFRWAQNTGMQTIITHGSSSTSLRTSSATAVSDDGTTIYGSGQAFNNGLYAFRSIGGYVQTNYPMPSAVSADGTVVAGNRLALPGPGTSTAFRDEWFASESLPLGDFSGGATDAFAMDISADGAVIVGRGTTQFGQEPFVWTEANGMQLLGPLPVEFWDGAIANAVSADGRVIVGEGYGGVGGAFVWTQVDGFRLLADILTGAGLDLQGWQAVLAANDVSGDGHTIVGYGVNPAGRFEAYIAEIPLPDTATLLLTGTLIVLFAFRSR